MIITFSKPATYSGRKRIEATLSGLCTDVEATPMLLIIQVLKGSGEANNVYIIQNQYASEHFQSVQYKTLAKDLTLKNAKKLAEELLKSVTDISHGGELTFLLN